MSDAAANSRSKVKALVVDDEALIRMNTIDMLEELGFTSLEAGNADDALLFLSRHADIGILIADLQLPGTSGEELVRRARELHPRLKIVVASGHAADHFAARAEFAGVAFLGKPFNFSQLRRAIEKA